MHLVRGDYLLYWATHFVSLYLFFVFSFLVEAPWDDGTCPRIAEMVLDAIPLAIHKSSLILTSGQALYPFAEAPHIANDGIILHGRSAQQRALENRAIHQSGCLSFPQM